MMLHTDIDYDADEWQRREDDRDAEQVAEWQYRDYHEQWAMLIALAQGFISAEYYRRYVERQTLAQVYGGLA